jgi:hypothetical protein
VNKEITANFKMDETDVLREEMRLFTDAALRLNELQTNRFVKLMKDCNLARDRTSEVQTKYLMELFDTTPQEVFKHLEPYVRIKLFTVEPIRYGWRRITLNEDFGRRI